ncbi:MAG: phosphorylase family protein, partial [Solirubrobacterales bacterium]
GGGPPCPGGGAHPFGLRGGVPAPPPAGGPWGGPPPTTHPRDGVAPDRRLTAALTAELGDERLAGIVASLDVLHRHHPESAVAADVADMQTAALFVAAARLDIEVAAVLIVSETSDRETIKDEDLETAAKRAGTAAAAALSP